MFSPMSLLIGTDLLDLSLEELLDLRITGCTLTEESVLTVPSAVSVFSQQSIAQMGFTTIEQLANFAPGFQSFNTGESGHSQPYSSRGRKVGTTSREVLVLIDGVRVDTTVYGGTPFAYPLIPLANVERVEFIRGAGSAIYGSNAFLGVVNIISCDRVNEIGTRLGTGGLIEGFVQKHLELGPVEGQIFLRGFSSEGQSSTVRNTFTGEPVQTSAEVEGYDLQARFSVGDTSLQVISMERAAPGFFVLGDVTEEFQGYWTDYQQVILKHRLSWNEQHETTVSASYRRWAEEIKGEILPPGALAGVSVPDSEAAMLGISDFRENEWSFALVHDCEMESVGHLVLGGEWRYADLTQAIGHSNFDLDALTAGRYPVMYSPEFDFEVTQVAPSDCTILGLFAQYQRSFWEDLELTLGVRYDDYTEEGSRTSPRLGLVYNLNRSWTLKALYGEAFRAPSLVEKFTTSTVLVGNPKLESEIVKTRELIVMWHDERQAFSLGYFHNDFFNGIVGVEVEGICTFENRGIEENSGIEVEYNLTFADHEFYRWCLEPECLCTLPGRT